MRAEARWGWFVSVLLIAWLATGSLARGAPATGGDPSQQLVFAGLLPLKKSNGSADLGKLGEAQQLRALAENALADVTQHPIVGHDDLRRKLGDKYLVAWFNCAGQLACITSLLAPLGDAGFKVAATGEYYVEDGTYKIRIVTFAIADGKIGKTVDFELAAADVKNPEPWHAPLASFKQTVGGRVRLVTNVASPTCKLDGADCPLDAETQTMPAPVGDHTIELTKEGYNAEKAIVTVKVGATTEVAIALKPAGKQVATGPVGRQKPILNAVRTDHPPVIDGKLDDQVWQKAWLETNFTQSIPDEKTAPTERTELRVLFDDEAVYVGVRCFDAHPEQIVARLTRRDRDIDSDKVTVDISSKNDHASAYHFEINAAGRQLDGLRSNDTDFSTDWDGLWYSAVTRDNLGWTAEFAIPLVALRYEGDTTSFGMQVRRYIQRREEVDEWSYIPRTVQGEVSYYGELDGLTGLNAKRLFQLSPYDSRNLTLRYHQPPLNGAVFGDRFGADIKLGLTNALTLDATIDPDFGTVEVDQVVLNLSTIETYFPEKRPFFIEGADIYSTPLQLFYSRRVGATPPDPQVAGNEAVVAPPPTGQIYGATKVTGLLAGRLSIGAMDAVTAREDTVINRGLGGANENWLVAPTTNYGVLRLRQEFGTNSSIGMLATSVNRFEPPNAATPQPGDQCPVPYFGLDSVSGPNNGRCTSDAYTGGVDTRLRTSDGTWGASAQGVGSVLEHGPTRFVPDGTLIQPGKPGYGVSAEAGKYGGEDWLGKVAYTSATPNLDLNDAGYLPYANYQTFFAALTRRSTHPWGPFRDRSLSLNASVARAWNLHNPNETGAYLVGSLLFSNFWSINSIIYPYYRPWDNIRDAHDGAAIEKTSGYFYNLDVKTDPRSAVIVEYIGAVQKNLRGNNFQNQLMFSLRTFSALELDLIGNGNISTGDPRWFYTQPNADGSNTYYLGDLDARSFQTTLRGTYTFSPRLSLQAYTQVFVASADYTSKITASTAMGAKPYLGISSFQPVAYPTAAPNPNFREGTFNVNVFLRWEYLPGSALWLVYTHAQQQTAYDPTDEMPAQLRFDRFAGGPAADVFLIKVSYLWEPLRK